MESDGLMTFGFWLSRNLLATSKRDPPVAGHSRSSAGHIAPSGRYESDHFSGVQRLRRPERHLPISRHPIQESPVRRIVSLAFVLAVCGPAFAQPKIGPDPKDVQAVVDKAYEFLKSPAEGGRVVRAGPRRAGDHGPDRRRPDPPRQAGRRPGGRQGPRLPGEERPEGRRHLQQVPRQLHDVHRDRHLQGGEQGRQVRRGHRQRGQVPEGDPARRAGRGACRSAGSGTTASPGRTRRTRTSRSRPCSPPACPRTTRRSRTP